MDMDAFFASVEQMDNPTLRHKCLVVGGASNRGVVAAASYEARRFGIHSAMPIFQAKQKCTELIIVPPRRHRYAELSRRIMTILQSFSPLVEPISIDEAFIDITGCQRLHGSPRDTALAVKAQIRDNVHLTCSVGVAPNKFLAKIASDLQKPDGLTVITEDQMPSFIHCLAIDKVPGVGRRTLEQLTDMGIKTLGQVNSCAPAILTRRLGKFGQRLVELANGRDSSAVVPSREAKSISSETTLDHDTRDPAILAVHLLSQSQEISRQLRRQGVRARTIVLKVKTADFHSHTRNLSLPAPTQSSDKIYQTALALLSSLNTKTPFRLVGVGASGLQPLTKPVQNPLFPDGEETRQSRWEKIDRTVDAIVNRFGGRPVVRGTLAPADKERK